jgi:hypothetical protein
MIFLNKTLIVISRREPPLHGLIHPQSSATCSRPGRSLHIPRPRHAGSPSLLTIQDQRPAQGLCVTLLSCYGSGGGCWGRLCGPSCTS